MKTLKRIVALSDTHGKLDQFEYIKKNKIQGDLFIHAGDFTKYNKQEGLQSFLKELEDLKFRHKIVISGNHQFILDQKINPQHHKIFREKFPCLLNRSQILQKLRTKCLYLQHQGVEIEGVKIFGTPFSQSFSRKGAFQYTDQNQYTIFNSIPEQIDILITHSPPFGILDIALDGQSVGSKALLNKVLKIKPKIHIFGHVHESHGIRLQHGITFINAATELKQYL